MSSVTAPSTADNRGEAAGGAVQGKRAGLAPAVQGGLEGGQHLGHQHGGEDALDHAGRDEDPDVRGQPAQGGGNHEADGADLEQPAPADPVAQAAAQNQDGGVGDAVARDDQFQGGPGGVQGPVDGRQGHVGDEEVRLRHERPGHQDEHPERGQAPRPGHGTGRRRPSRHGR
jgi:hypothetical protein